MAFTGVLSKMFTVRYRMCSIRNYICSQRRQNKAEVEDEYIAVASFVIQTRNNFETSDDKFTQNIKRDPMETRKLDYMFDLWRSKNMSH